MKGIILAGGLGTRLFPLTRSVSKHLLPVYDKPMIYYPLSTLMQAGIREILIITTKRDLVSYQQLFEDGKKIGLDIYYAVQDKPNGLAEAFIIGEDFIKQDRVALILGDNIFYGSSLTTIIKRAMDSNEKDNSWVFAYYSKDPRPYGVIEFDNKRRVVSIEEKPVQPRSDYIIPGLYFYGNDVIEIAKRIKPSERGEMEITNVNQEYLKQGKLRAELLEENIMWYDAGNVDGLMEASCFVRKTQKMQGAYIACIEEIAYQMGFISKKELLMLADFYKQTQYGQYLYEILNKE